MPRATRSSLLVLTLLVAGCSDSSGPKGVFGCDSVARYNIGETVNGAIRTSDCLAPEGEGYMDFYQFRQAASGPVSFTADLPVGSVLMGIVIFDTDENIVDLAVVGPGEEASIGGLLDEGTYIFAVASETAGAQSTYSFTSARSLPSMGPPFLNCTVAQAYTFGGTVNGTLEPGDCITPEGPYLDRHQFTLATARTVTITMTSGEVDSYLYLFDAAGAILARNDDFEIGSLNSRISVSLPAGTYSIGASTYESFEAGSYTLRTQ